MQLAACGLQLTSSAIILFNQTASFSSNFTSKCILLIALLAPYPNRMIQYTLFKSLIELTSDAVFIVRVDPGGREFYMEYVNPAYLTKFGVTPESVIGKEFKEMLRDSILDSIRLRFIECVEKEQSISFEENFEDKTTSLSELFPIKDETGKITHIAGISKDITELKLNRDKIAASERTLQSIINSSDNVLLYISKDLRIKYANRKAQQHAIKLFGRPFETGNLLSDYYPEEYNTVGKEYLRLIFEEKKSISHEHLITYPDGETQWYHRRSFAVFEDNGDISGVVIASTNITNRKTQELQIQKHLDALKEIAKIQSHEIRRPVANITGLTDLIDLKNKSVEENEQILQYLKISAHELDQMIIRIVSKTQSGE